jgi:hypothetical protein
MNTLTHIAPQLPPAIDGVGDYCWNLWRHRPESETRWQFLALHGVAKTREHWSEVEVGGFNANPESLRRALEFAGAQTVVLHYVGYGFQPKGIPIWLPEALRCWRSGDASGRRLVTMFHEMYARSSPLRSPFWVAPFARGIIRDLVKLSDAWITSCDRYFEQLVNEFGASAELGRIIPIGSNVPVVSERGTNRRMVSAKLKLVSFGLAKTRLWALERHWKLLRHLNERGALECITLLGKRGVDADTRAEDSFIQRIGSGVNWHRRFDLSAKELSHELHQHDLGILANEPDILTKSGVFAALANHGVVPIVAARNVAALPQFIQPAVLANDDGERIPQIERAISEPGRLEALRESVLAIESRELSWPRIAQSWNEVLQSKGLIAAPRCDGRAASKPLACLDAAMEPNKEVAA